MKWLVFDFETTGVGTDKSNGYSPYKIEQMPLPRTNFPVQLCAKLVDDNGEVSQTLNTLIKGAVRFDPWVQQNCRHLSVQDCEYGIDVEEMIRNLADMIPDNDECTLVAHNIQYDWEEVIMKTVEEFELQESSSFLKLKQCQQYCTCINNKTRSINNGNMKAYFYKKIGKWIGPSLANLAHNYNVPYDINKAHNAEYDVDITIKCFLEIRKEL